MASALIGALRVSLGIDSAQFSAGLKGAQAGLAKFGKSAAIGLAAVTAGAVAAGAALGVAVKGAIDHADELSKTAQKVGVATEALSRLEWAAKLSDVSLEQLSGGLTKLSKSMGDVALGKGGTAATAFKALGISVTDAAGKLKASDVVLSEVAAQFARLEDGSTKTALAVALFGRSGAELIPLLNSGADGLAEMAKESDRLGLTIGTKTGKAAEAFNDTLTRIQAVLGGVVNKVMEAALPALQEFASFLASPEFASAAQTFATTAIELLKGVAQAIVGITNAARDLFTYLSANGSTAGMGTLKLAQEIAATTEYLKNNNLNSVARERSENALRQMQQQMAGQAKWGTPLFGAPAAAAPAATKPGGTTTPPPLDINWTSLGKAKGEVIDLMAEVDKATPKVENFAASIGDTLADSFTGMAEAVIGGKNALAALGDELGNIGKMLLNSAISSFFSNLFGGGFGGGNPLSRVGSFSIGGMPTYAGGGYTGSGSRSGGLDGQGGFMAMLHPDETVVDHAAGQSFGGGGQSEVLIRLDRGMVAEILKQADGNAVKIVDARAPAAVAKTQRNRGL